MSAGNELENIEPQNEKAKRRSRRTEAQLLNDENQGLADLHGRNEFGRSRRLQQQNVEVENIFDVLILENCDLPKSYDEAVNGIYARQWIKAMQEEMDAFQRTGTYEVVDKPKDKNIIGNKWIFKIKPGIDGKLEKFKARLVAQGFTQKRGKDFDETFSPLVKINSLRILLAIANSCDLDVHHMDVSTAFLNAKLEEEVYLKQAPGFETEEGKVWKLKRAVYGLRQSPREWYKCMNKYLQEQGFEKLNYDGNLYRFKNGEEWCIIALYVDDNIMVAKGMKTLLKCKEILNNKFQMSDLGELKRFLGIEVYRNRDSKVLTLSQQTQIQNMLSRFGMKECNAASTPIVPGHKISKQMSPQTEEEKKQMEEVPYRSLIGCLSYVANCTRPDISFAVNLLSRYNHDPGKAHWMAAKRILRYLKGTLHFGIMYNTCDLKLKAYCDADWGGDLDQRRSTSGYMTMLGGAPVAWKSKKQNCIALSSAEAEYNFASLAVKEIIWERRLMDELGFSQLNSTVMFCDSTSCIAMSKNPVLHERSKHIEMEVHFLREMVEKNQVHLTYIGTKDQLADMLTKALPVTRFEELRSLVNCCSSEILPEGENDEN